MCVPHLCAPVNKQAWTSGISKSPSPTPSWAARPVPREPIHFLCELHTCLFLSLWPSPLLVQATSSLAHLAWLTLPHCPPSNQALLKGSSCPAWACGHWERELSYVWFWGSFSRVWVGWVKALASALPQRSKAAHTVQTQGSSVSTPLMPCNSLSEPTESTMTLFLVSGSRSNTVLNAPSLQIPVLTVSAM